MTTTVWYVEIMSDARTTHGRLQLSTRREGAPREVRRADLSSILLRELFESQDRLEREADERVGKEAE